MVEAILDKLQGVGDGEYYGEMDSAQCMTTPNMPSLTLIV